jgi:hypothetical protein
VRKLLIGALVGAIALVGATIALAQSGGTIQTYTETFSAKKPGKSTTTSFKTTNTDPTNTANNNQPDPGRIVKIKFPGGTKLTSTGVVPQCVTPNLNAQNVCPPNTKIGSGTAQARTKFPGTAPIAATVTAYNKKNGLFLHVNAPSVNQQFILTASYSGTTLTAVIPPQCVPPDHVQGSGASAFCATASGAPSPNGEVALTQFSLSTSAKSKKIKGKTVPFLATPKKCPKNKKWVFIGTFTFKSGATKAITSTSPCTS